MIAESHKHAITRILESAPGMGPIRVAQPHAQEIFKGAATTVVTQPEAYALYAAYQHMTESGTKPNLAKVTLARMIAAIVLRMWKDQEVIIAAVGRIVSVPAVGGLHHRYDRVAA